MPGPLRTFSLSSPLATVPVTVVVFVRVRPIHIGDRQRLACRGRSGWHTAALCGFCRGLVLNRQQFNTHRNHLRHLQPTQLALRCLPHNPQEVLCTPDGCKNGTGGQCCHHFASGRIIKLRTPRAYNHRSTHGCRCLCHAARIQKQDQPQHEHQEMGKLICLSNCLPICQNSLHHARSQIVLSSPFMIFGSNCASNSVERADEFCSLLLIKSGRGACSTSFSATCRRRRAS